MLCYLIDPDLIIIELVLFIYELVILIMNIVLDILIFLFIVKFLDDQLLFLED